MMKLNIYGVEKKLKENIKGARRWKLKILYIENGIDMIGDTPSPDFVFNVMPIERTTSPIE